MLDDDYSPLAKAYARKLPPSSPMDWEDIYQEMMIGYMQNPTVKSAAWAASHFVRYEWVRATPRELAWEPSHRVYLETICEAYHFIEKWPWMLGFLFYESWRAVAADMGVSKTYINRRLAKIRRQIKNGFIYSTL